MTTMPQPNLNYTKLEEAIRQHALTLGLQQLGIADVDLSLTEARLAEWLRCNWHGDMKFMEHHGSKRCRPNELLPGTLRIISVRLDYLPRPMLEQTAQLANPDGAYIACYALGRDYHKLLRRRLQLLISYIETIVSKFNYRAFTDSAPVMEKPLAEKAGLGWIGKHTNLVDSKAGSWFFLGEIYTDLPLPISIPTTNHCGTCQACMNVCPTRAIVAPYHLDARRCIAYLTIEYHGVIPLSLRSLIGNRIFGCDDCQRACPWNRFARLTMEADFLPRQQWQQAKLVDLFAWSEMEFLRHTEGSAIRRLGWQRWLRNIAIALGNAPSHPDVITALQTRMTHPDMLVREHVQWAIERHKTL